jgi:hypothetical protein
VSCTSQPWCVMPAAMSPMPDQGVEPLAHEPQLWRVVAQEHGSERRTQAAAAGASSSGRSLDDVVRLRQQRRRDREAERFRGLEVDHQLELCRLLDGKVSRLGTFQDFVDIGG